MLVKLRVVHHGRRALRRRRAVVAVALGELGFLLGAALLGPGLRLGPGVSPAAVAAAGAAGAMLGGGLCGSGGGGVVVRDLEVVELSGADEVQLPLVLVVLVDVEVILPDVLEGRRAAPGGVDDEVHGDALLLREGDGS